MRSLPYYRIVRAFQETYHTTQKGNVYHLMICLSCGHWRRIRNHTTSMSIVGRLFSCKESHG